MGPTIVAIFNAANTYDIETGSLAVSKKSLRSLKGKAFDRAFLEHEVDYHNAVLDAVTHTLLPATQNAQVKDLLTKVAPAVVAHRDRAQSLLNEQK